MLERPADGGRLNQMRQYKTLRALRRGEMVTVDGTDYIMLGDGEVKAGDTYIAERNTGPVLLQAEAIRDGWIRPTTMEYSYDVGECVKVIRAIAI